MTIEGTVNKTGMLLIFLTITAAWTWSKVSGAEPSSMYGWMAAGGIAGFLLAIGIAFKPRWAPALAPLYAGVEGIFVGALSAFAESFFPGIVFQAVILTFGTLLGLLLAYRSGMIRATENFKLGIVAATVGILAVYLISIVLSFFGLSIPLIHGSGPVGILFSLFVVVIAALNLVLDFDFIENGAKSGAPRHMEWYGAFGLMVTLIWLYVEILRLLMKLRSR